MKRTAAALSLGAVWALSLATVGVAEATSPAHVYKACANKHGVLSIETKGKCAKGTTVIGLDSPGVEGLTGKSGVAGATGLTGATGPAGAAGAAGVQGLVGARGPSDLYYSSGYGPAVPLTVSVATQVVQTVKVPAGDYVAIGVADVTNMASDAGFVSCEFTKTVDNGVVQRDSVPALPHLPATYPFSFGQALDASGDPASITVMDRLTLTETDAIALTCTATHSSEAQSDFSDIDLIQVGTVHLNPPVPE